MLDELAIESMRARFAVCTAINHRTSKRALIARIRRRLPSTHRLRATRGGPYSRTRCDLGDFYLFDLERNVLVATHVDLETLCAELRCRSGDDASERPPGSSEAG